MSTRQRKNINLIYLSKILNTSPNYFIVSTALSTDDKINNFKYDLLVVGLFCIKLKNAFYNVLQQESIINNYGRLSGVHCIIFSLHSNFVNYAPLLEILAKYRNEIFFNIGKINNVVYDKWRLRRALFDCDKLQAQKNFVSTVFCHYTFSLPLLLRYSFLNILYLCQLAIRRI